MAVTDLTGTKWIINEIPNIPSSTNYALDFTSNGGEYNGFVFAYNGIMFRGDTLTPVYMPSDQGWYSDNFRTIEIAGGTDATNTNLISWLQANATQIIEPTITDLTGTKWLIREDMSNEILNLLGGTPVSETVKTIWNVNFTSNNTDYESIGVTSSNGNTWNMFLYNTESVWMVMWYDEAFRTIEITGGTDATNADLITWLQANATQIVEPIGNAYEITHSLTNLTHGNVSFTITPDTGYALPSSVTVTDGTLVSYDSSTGVIVVSGDDAEISVGCEATAQSFSTIHLCGVYEAYGYTEYAINSSSAQTISQANNAGVSRANMTFALAQQYSLTLSDVSSLKIRTFDEYKIYAFDGSVIADWSSTMPSSMDSDGFYEFISALSEGCYVCVYYND